MDNGKPKGANSYGSIWKRSAVVAICIGLLLNGFFAAVAQPLYEEVIVKTDDIDKNPMTADEIKTKVPGLMGYFTENQGQVKNDEILYYVHNSVAFTKSSVTFHMRKTVEQTSSDAMEYRNSYEEFTKERVVTGVVFVIEFENANDVVPVGLDEMSHKSNYFIGDPAGWRTNVPNYGTILYPNLYDGIDLVYRLNGGVLKYDFIIQPNADPSKIRMSYDGIEGLENARDGSLEIKTALGEIRDTGLYIYQDVDGMQSKVDGKFKILNDRSVGFEIDGSYDRSSPLVIDPALMYSALIGGDSDEWGYDVKVDSIGNAYVIGDTSSNTEFPTTPGAYQTTYAGAMTDVFITKCNVDCSALVYSTYLGSDGNDNAGGMALDSSGSVYVTGSTDGGSANPFPTTPGAYNPSINGMTDAFVTKLDPSGSGLTYSTYFGGLNADLGRNVALDSTDQAYVIGETMSNDLPVSGGAYDTSFNAPDSDVFFIRLNAAGDTLQYCTYLGSPGMDNAFGIAVDTAGDAYITGYTWNENFPTTAGAYDEIFNNPGLFITDAFFAIISPAGLGLSDLSYSTFLGGGQAESGNDIAIDASGIAYIVGSTDSIDFPTSGSVWDDSHNGNDDVFVLKLDPAGGGLSDLQYSTFIGDAGADAGNGIALEPSGIVQITGRTFSSDYPTTLGAYDSTYDGSGDIFITRLSDDASDLLYSTLVPGEASDEGHAITIDSSLDTYVTGVTASNGFPTTALVFLPGRDKNGTMDAFISKFGIADAPPTIEVYEPGGTPGQSYTEGNIVQVNWLATDNNPLPLNPINISYGDPIGGWTVVATNEANDGIYNWDTTGVDCPGTYYMSVSVYDSANQTRFDDSNYSFDMFCSGADSFPTIRAYEPGGTPNQVYIEGSVITVTWHANDDNPLPANPIDITYGFPGSWTPIVSGVANTGSYLWDTLGVFPGGYWMNISVTDSFGQTSFNESNYSFEIIPDLPPFIVFTIPANNDIISVNQGIQITFSEVIDTTTFNYTITPSDPGGWNWIWSMGNTVVTGTHADFLPATTYNFTVNAANDTGGKMLFPGPVPNPWNFTAIDNILPMIVSTTPFNGETGVAVNQAVQVNFSEPIDTATFAYTITSTAGDPGGWLWTWTVGDTVVTGTHIPFQQAITYTFTVTSADDVAGNPLTGGPVQNPWSWTTVDPNPPIIIVTSPFDGETDIAVDKSVQITFNDMINIGTFTYLVVPDPGGWTPFWNIGNTVVTLTHNAFAQCTEYDFFVTAADDMSGNPLAPGIVPNPWNWTTICDNPPTIETWEPGGTSGQSHNEGDLVTVIWEATDDNLLPPNPINISYGNPGSWTLIASGEVDDGAYNWDTSGVPCPGTYWMNVSVYDSAGQESFDLSNFTFDIDCADLPPTIEAWEPGGTPGQTHTEGDTIQVTWFADDDNALPLNPINISYGNPGSWTTITTGEADDGVYNWDTTGEPCPNSYYMRLSVYDSIGQSTIDDSNFSFQLNCPGIDNPPTITVLEPGSIGGQTFTEGDVITVEWVAIDDNAWPNSDNVVNISYGILGSWTTIVVNEQEDGTYLWDTTGVLCPNDYRMNLSVYDSIGQTNYDLSTNVFSIFCPGVDNPPTITVYEPGGFSGQTYTEGEMITVSWTANDDSMLPATPINITYGTPGSWTTVATDQVNDGDYTWDSTGVPCPATYWMNLSVYDNASQTTHGTSSNGFTIDCQPTKGDITVTVKDEDNAVIIGATVTLRNSTGALLGTGATGTDGNITFINVEPATIEYTVTAEKPQYETSSMVGISVIAGDTAFVVLVLNTNATISGNIVDEDNDPIPGATVTLQNEDGVIVTYVVTDANGEFTFVMLDYGNYTIIIEADGYEEKTIGPYIITQNDRAITVTDEVLTATPPPPTGDLLWLWLLIIAIIVILVIIVLLLLMRRKPEEAEPLAEEPEADEAAPEKDEAAEPAMDSAEVKAKPATATVSTLGIMTCNNCGETLESDYEICPYCGEEIIV